MSKLKLIGVALIGWIGLIFTAAVYYVAIAGIIKAFF
tara:strand:- start:182 stop:292 length:111 start_codon:yes stop_codon:yes gene_type:complete